MKHGLLYALLLGFLISHPIATLAASASPEDLSRETLKRTDLFDPADHTPYRFKQKPGWGNGIRVSISKGGSVPRGPKKFGIYENRYFFLKVPGNSVTQALDLPETFRNSHEMRITPPRTESPKVKNFKIEVDKSGMMASIRVSCDARAEYSDPLSTTGSQYIRYQLVLSQCLLNGKSVLLDKAWLTLDVHQFPGVSDRSGIQVRSLYLSNVITVETRLKNIELSQQQLHDFSVLITDQLLLGVFQRLGARVDKDFLWTHQP